VTESAKHERVLITRTDRLGDVLLAIPALLAVADSLPSTLVGFLVRKEWMPLLHLRPSITLIEYDPEGRHKGPLGFARLVHDVRSFHAQTSVSLVHSAQVASALFAAKIPIRIGPYSKASSFILYNAGVRQRRSLVQKHESEYNLDLVEYVPGVKRANASNEVSVGHLASQAMDQILEKHSFARKSYVVFHLGSRGSSKYLDLDQMADLLKKTVFAGYRIIATGSASDAGVLKALRSRFDPGAAIWWQGLESPVGLPELASLIQGAQAFFGHSTGPLHLAAALGVPTYGVFPSQAVLSPRRWGAIGPLARNWSPKQGSMNEFQSEDVIGFLKEFAK
jgi:ADP-heptose:LPS heptosyltransferase